MDTLSRNKFGKLPVVMLLNVAVLCGCQGIEPFSKASNSVPTIYADGGDGGETPQKGSISLGKRARAFTDLPEIKALARRIEASQLLTTSISLANSMTVSATSNSGFVPDQTNGVVGYVDAQIIAEKPIYDGNRIALRTATTELETRTLELELKQRLNAIAIEIAENKVLVGYSEKIVTSIDEALDEYKSNEQMLETLVNAGIVQKLEYLDLQQRVQGIKALRHSYVASMLRADSVLSTKYPGFSAFSPVSLDFILDVTLDDEKSLQSERLELNKQSMLINQKLKRAEKSWGTSIATSLSMTSNADDPEVFSGIRFTLPVSDGGQVDAAVASIGDQIAAITADLEAHKINQKSASSLWENKKVEYREAKEINALQRNLVEERQIDLDRQLNAGRAKLDQVIANKLTLLDLTVRDIELQQEVFVVGLNTFADSSDGCLILSTCEEFKSITEGLSVNE